MTRVSATGAPSHVASTVALCACSLINAYLLVSVLPYAGYMAINFLDGVTQDNVGTCAGLFASSFMVGRTLSAYPWGKIADIYGRTFVLNSCLALSAVFSVMFGVARTFRAALFWRFCLGIANGIIGATKTLATELSDGDSTVERRTMGLVIGMRSWGYLLSPALGGLLADPVQQYPSFTWLHRGWTGWLLIRYPFLLPNLVGCVACLVTVALVTCCVHETLPESKRRKPSDLPGDVAEWVQPKIGLSITTRRIRSNHATTELWVLLPTNSLDRENGKTAHSKPIELHADDEQLVSVWERPTTRKLLLAHWMYSFVSMCLDQLFPLFCMSQTGGLGLSEASIGKVLSGAGLLFALSQYAVFSTLVYRFGEYSCLVIGSLFGIQSATFIPSSLLVKKTVVLSWSVFSILSIIMAVCKLFGLLYFASLALAINETVPASQRATMNGMVVLGASFARAIAPTFAGALSSFSFSSLIFPAKYGSLLMYGTLSISGALVTLRVCHLKKEPVNNVNSKESTHYQEYKCITSR